MKFIHCADLHLNSPLTTKLSPKKAERIKRETFLAFEKLISIAKNDSVSVIVIAGDLFDGNVINPSVLTRLKQAVTMAKKIKFIYVYGNHDYNPTQNPFKDFPPNFIQLEKNQSVKIEDATFTAHSENLIPLTQDDYNVVIGHGDETTNPKIDLVSLRGKNIDYLALGHIHSARLGKLDERGVWTYSGCLYPRGWDECGEKGYYLIDTISRTYAFIPLKGFTFNEYQKDVSPYNTLLEFETDVQKELSKFDDDIALRLIITGEIHDPDFIDFSYLHTLLSQKFYHFEIKDKSEINFSSLNLSVSLKSEFIKVVNSNAYTEEQKKKIIETGLKYLK